MKKILTALILALSVLLLLTSCGFTVPRPEIKEREFNFSVTYEYGGETKTVSGVYVCEYNGTKWALDGGYYRDWTGYIKGGKIEDHVVIDTVDGDEVILVLGLVPDYFMGDFNTELYSDPLPYIPHMMIKSYGDDGSMSIIYESDVIEEIYGARIISYEYDEPVENTFGLFK